MSPDAPPPLNSPFDPALAQSGRVLTLAALWGIYALATVPFLATLLRGAGSLPAATVGRGVLTAAVTALLLNAVWRGRVWAWRVTVSLCMLAGFLVFIGGMLASGNGPRGWLVSAAGIGYLALGLALVGAPAIRAFLDTRWGRP